MCISRDKTICERMLSLLFSKDSDGVSLTDIMS